MTQSPHKTLFSIFYVGRQGSSFLEGLLDSHPDIRCEGELFSSGAKYLADILRRRTTSYRNFRGDIPTYLRWYNERNDYRAVGFKMGHGHLLRHPEAERVMADMGYSVILVTRDNLFDQYISVRLAEINRTGRSDYGPMRTMRFVGDVAEAERFFEHSTAANAALAAIAARFPSTAVSYEELVAGNATPRLLNFLGVDDRPLTSRYKRQRSGSQRDVVENYAQLRDHFAGTKWARFFVDP